MAGSEAQALARETWLRPGGARRTDLLALGLVGAAGLAWWLTWTAPMPVALPGFLLGWLVMMAAMMLPTLVPVVALYLRAARRGTVAPVGVFLAGYLLVWTAPGLPAYAAWRAVTPGVMAGTTTSARWAGGVLLLAAVYELTPLKAACLRGCRSPITAFTTVRGSLADPAVALRAGARNGLWCLGCCWAFMSVLVAVGLMHPWWMVGLAAVIFVEKVLPAQAWVPRVVAALLAVAGGALLTTPSLLMP